MSRTFLMQYGRVTACFLMLLVTAAPAWALSISTGPNGSNVQAVHALDYTGQNVKIGLISAAHARVTHEAFAGAVTWYDATGENVCEPFWHDTSMAGIICSRGSAAYPNHKGVAPGSEVLTVRVTTPIAGSSNRNYSFSWLADGLSKIKNEGGRVVVTGIQFGGTADGESSNSLIYDYYAYQYGLIIATAAGNTMSGPVTNITSIGDTYNSITTAGLILENSTTYNQGGTWSNKGPTIDGRRKPEVAAPSQNQWVPTHSSDTAWKTEGIYPRGETSWSVCHTAGVAAVLLSYADTTLDEPDDGRSEVIKAVMVNATFPNILAKNGTWTDPANITWHTDRGYGRLDALRAYETLIAPKIWPGDTIAESRGWAYQPLGPGQTHTYTLAAHEDQRLVATLTWHRRIKWTDKRVGSRPINGIIDHDELETFFANLDLQIYDPDGHTLIAEPPTLDNLEKVDIRLTKTGEYQITVSNLSESESANYALAFEVLEPLAGDWNNDYRVDTGDLYEMLDCWLDGCKLDVFESISSQWMMIDPRYWGP